MNKQKLINMIKELSDHHMSSFYKDLYNWIIKDTEETNHYLDELAKEEFEDVIDLIMYFEI